MPIKIALQAGHMGRTTGSTGSPGEQELTARIWKNLSQQLIERDFQLFLFAADPPIDATLKQDFDLFLALHGDADYAGDMGGGFADYPAEKYKNGEIQDFVSPESQRICKVINDNYFNETGIRYVNRSNENTKYYYMWKYLSKQTPCVIIELGQTQDPHDKVLLANTTLIVNALTRAICKAFNISYEVLPPTPPPTDPHLVEIEKLNTEIKRLNLELSNQASACETKIAQLLTDCSNYRTSDRNKIIQFIGGLE